MGKESPEAEATSPSPSRGNRKRGEPDDCEGWLVFEEEVARICHCLIRDSEGEDDNPLQTGGSIAQQVLRLCKRLDKGDLISVQTIADRDLRRRLRHLMEAMSMASVEIRTVPGAKPVTLSFRKPADCPLSIARLVKPFLVSAVAKLAREKATSEGSGRSGSEVIQPVPEERSQQIAAALEALRASDFQVETPKCESQEDEMPGPQERQATRRGLQTLEEYREGKGKGEVNGTEEGEEDEDLEGPTESLMEMRKKGLFKDDLVRRRAKEFEKMINLSSGLWGLSGNKQARVEAAAKKTWLQDAEEEEGEEDGEGEPWKRFNREELMEKITAQRDAQTAEKVLNEFVTIAQERTKGGFFKRSTTNK